MGKMTFLDDLARLDASTIPADNVSKANEMAKGLSVASAKKVSSAASELLTWVRNGSLIFYVNHLGTIKFCDIYPI